MNKVESKDLADADEAQVRHVWQAATTGLIKGLKETGIAGSTGHYDLYVGLQKLVMKTHEDLVGRKTLHDVENKCFNYIEKVKGFLKNAPTSQEVRDMEGYLRDDNEYVFYEKDPALPNLKDFESNINILGMTNLTKRDRGEARLMVTNTTLHCLALCSDKSSELLKKSIGISKKFQSIVDRPW